MHSDIIVPDNVQFMRESETKIQDGCSKNGYRPNNNSECLYETYRAIETRV